jgi:hypothetical protein
MANLSNINGKFVVDTAGNIGVGTLIPRSDANTTNISIQSSGTARLFVNNTGASGKEYAIYSSANGDFGIFDYGAVSARLVINSAGNATFAGDLSILSGKVFKMYNAANSGWAQVKFNETDNRIEINKGLQNSGADWLLSENSVNSFVCANQGSFGIGTDSPNANLDILNGTTGASLKLSATATAYWQLQRNSTTGNLNISDDALGNVMSFDQLTGNVGIGVTDPQSKLQVDGGIQMADDTDAAVATKVGTIRYRTGTEYVEVTGTELVTNGDFATDTDWTKAGTTISGGKAIWSSAASGWYILSTADTLTVGLQYSITFDISTISAGGLSFNDGVSSFTNRTTVGTYTETITAGGTQIKIRCNGVTTATVDNISIVEVTAEDASYADMCMQTEASTYEWVNIVRNTY